MILRKLKPQDYGVGFNSVYLSSPNLNASAAFETDTSKVFEVVLSQSFLEYGLWQDYGTGRETPRGNSGDLGRAKRRQRRSWFSRKFTSQSFH